MKIPSIPYVQGRNAYTDTDGRKYGIAIHNTANDAAAEQEAAYAARRTDGISAHLYVDADSIVQSLDTTSKAGHAGSAQGNENAVAVEITGVNGWTRQQWLDTVAWDKLGQVLAVVCRHYSIAVRRASVAEMKSNPKVRAFYGHDDMRLAWGGTTHTDPGPTFPWDRLFQAVNEALTGDDMTPEQDARLRNIERVATNADLAVWQLARMVETITGGRAPDGSSTPYPNALGATLGGLTAALAGMHAKLDAIGSRVDIDPAELAAITAAARAGAESGVVGAADELAAAVVAALPDGELTRADVETAVRSVLGSLDNPQG